MGGDRLTVDPPISIFLLMIFSRSSRNQDNITCYSLFETLRLEVSQGIIFNGIADLKRVAAHLTIFDIGVTVNREVQDHRDFFAAEGTGEGVFHNASTVPQITVA
jgi:hypothetical protein